MEISFPIAQSRVLAVSGAQVAHTGNTTETVLATIAVPANAMGLNGAVRIWPVWGHTNSANNKTLRVRVGGTGINGTAFMQGVVTTTVVTSGHLLVANRGATNSQMGSFPTTASFNASSVAMPTSSVDTTAAFNIYLTGLLASAGDSVSIEGYLAELITL